MKRSQSSANYSVVVRQVFRQTTRMEVNIWMDAMCNVIAEVGIIFLLKPFDCRVTVPSHFGRIGPPTTPYGPLSMAHPGREIRKHSILCAA